jgi:hypothetical protein
MNPTAEPMAICCDLSLGYDFIHENADLDIPKVYSKCWCKIPILVLTDLLQQYVHEAHALPLRHTRVDVFKLARDEPRQNTLKAAERSSMTRMEQLLLSNAVAMS